MYRAISVAALLCACVVGFGSLSYAEDEHGAEKETAHKHAENHDAGHEHAEAVAHEHANGDGHGHDGGHDHAHGAAATSAAHGSGDTHGHDEHGHDGHADGAHGHGVHDAHGDGHGDSHGSHGNTHPLSVDPDLAIFTVLAFGLAYLVLSKFAWKPIRAALDKRDAYVASQLEAAEKQAAESERLGKEHADQLSGASEEVRSLLDQARKEADAEKQAILDAAQAAAAAEKQNALVAIGAARGDALDDLANKSVDTAVGLAGKIVGRTLKKTDHSDLVADAVKQFTKTDA